MYVIHGTEDEIVPFSHGEGLFEALPEPSRMVPFWAKGAAHNNIEMGMPNAYIKRLYQFIRQCDRLNYPNQKKSGASLLGQGFAQIKAKVASSPSSPSARPVLNRYASQDNYHAAAAPSPTTTTRPSKQRKQKGTLVMRSTHNAGAASPPPASQRRTAPPAVSQCASSPNLSRKRHLARPAQVQLHSLQHHHSQRQHGQHCGARSSSGGNVLSASASSRPRRQYQSAGNVLSSSASSRRHSQPQGGQFGGFHGQSFARENALVLQTYRE